MMDALIYRPMLLPAVLLDYDTDKQQTGYMYPYHGRRAERTTSLSTLSSTLASDLRLLESDSLPSMFHVCLFESFLVCILAVEETLSSL
jgi:hypothetical protein